MEVNFVNLHMARKTTMDKNGLAKKKTGILKKNRAAKR